MTTLLMLLQDVRPGAVLADDLLDASGRVLLPGGSALGDATLAGLRRRGIETLRIEVIEPDDADRRAAHRLVLEQELRVRFRCAGDGDASRLLFRATLEYMLEKTP